MNVATEARVVPYMIGTETSPLEPDIVEALCTVYDPEIPVSIFALGLVYDISISDDGEVKIVMTLTSPTCPVAEELPSMIQQAVGSVDGVSNVEMELVWEPTWVPEFMAEDARLQLGLM